MADERGPTRYTFPRAMRLSGQRAFSRVYDAKVRASAGPLLVYAAPNKAAHPRMGMSVSRTVGNAVKRNAIKRRLREAFRLSQHQWPPSPHGYDVVISVRPHDPLSVDEYRTHLLDAVASLVKTWSKRNPINP